MLTRSFHTLIHNRLSIDESICIVDNANVCQSILKYYLHVITHQCYEKCNKSASKEVHKGVIQQLLYNTIKVFVKLKTFAFTRALTSLERFKGTVGSPQGA